MKHVDLNDYLSAKSNWPRRLLGWEQYSVDRTAGLVATEYDHDRYAPLMELTSKKIKDCRDQEFANLGMLNRSMGFFSVGDTILQSTLSIVRTLWESVILGYVRRFATGTICELGCGYGYNLSLLPEGGYGGDYSHHAAR